MLKVPCEQIARTTYKSVIDNADTTGNSGKKTYP